MHEIFNSDLKTHSDKKQCCYVIATVLPLDPILNQKNPVHILTLYFFKIHF
jgi:hypothetical protein